jgi:hypothetical protein
MHGTTPYALSQLLSDLTGRQVGATLVLNPPASKSTQVFGEYEVLPSGKPLVVRADLGLLAVLGGSLLGLPSETAVERAHETPMDEPIRDAVHEVLNILSVVVALEGRVVFKKMSREGSTLESGALDLVDHPESRSSFQFIFGGKPIGLLTVYA